MRKSTLLALLTTFALILSACGSAMVSPTNQNEIAQNTQSETGELTERSEPIKQSTDKNLSYIKDYTGKNLATIGYVSLGGDFRDKYGATTVELIPVTADGSYIDFESEDVLKQYKVANQSVKPNTELRMDFKKDDQGAETGTVSYQNIEEILLHVTETSGKYEKIEFTPITISPDKYTWYISDYTGRNLASSGYNSLGGDFRSKYGDGSLKIVIITDDGSFVDTENEDELRNYIVTGQNIAPNTELKYTFATGPDGEEKTFPDTQTVNEIELTVRGLDKN